MFHTYIHIRISICIRNPYILAPSSPTHPTPWGGGHGVYVGLGAFEAKIICVYTCIYVYIYMYLLH